MEQNSKTESHLGFDARAAAAPAYAAIVVALTIAWGLPGLIGGSALSLGLLVVSLLRLKNRVFLTAGILVTFLILGIVGFLSGEFRSRKTEDGESPSLSSLSLASRDCPRVHAVQAGQTVYGIADSYGVAGDLLLQTNGIRLPEELKVGESLYIPCPNRGGNGPGNQEDVDDRPQITYLARRVTDCFRQVANSSPTKQMGCMDDLPTSGEEVAGKLVYLTDDIREKLPMGPCVAHRNLAAAALIEGELARLTLSDEYQSSTGDQSTLSLRVIMKIELVREGDSWIDSVLFGLVDEIGLDGEPVLSCT